MSLPSLGIICARCDGTVIKKGGKIFATFYTLVHFKIGTKMHKFIRILRHTFSGQISIYATLATTLTLVKSE